MSTRQELERIMKIHQRIRNGTYPSVKRLVEDLEVSRRTVLYDLKFLRTRYGAPLAYSRERRGYYYTELTWTLPTVVVTEGELMAFFLSVEVAQRYLGTPFEQPLRQAVAKLSKSMVSDVRVDLEELRQYYTFAAPASPSVDARLLADLTNAIRQRQQVQIRYHSAHRNEVTDRKVDPYHLNNISGDWVLIAFDHLREAWRDFHLGRVLEWHVLSQRFQRVPFSAEQYMQSAFRYQHGGEVQHIEIRFDAYQARWMRERLWHQTQEPPKELPDGGLILHFCSTGLEEVKRWVLQYGSHAEVLAPAELRQMVSGELAMATALYGSTEG